jgi:hypothetical protein
VPINSNDIWYRAVDNRQASVGVGIMTTGSITEALNLIGIAGGGLVLNTRNLISTRNVKGLHTAKKTNRLKIPSKASSLKKWQEGDRIDYDVTVTGVGLIGVGAVGVGVGVGAMPSARGGCRISITKLANNFAEVQAIKTKALSISGVAHEAIIQHRISATKGKQKGKKFVIDHELNEGVKTFNNFMKYQYLFPSDRDHMLNKAAKKAVDHGDYVIEVELKK